MNIFENVFLRKSNHIALKILIPSVTIITVSIENNQANDQYLDIGTIYGLNIIAGQPQQYQIIDSQQLLQINATDFDNVFMCISSSTQWRSQKQLSVTYLFLQKELMIQLLDISMY
ncbi:Hypothetical_protein [Hexamita inflata]|uniref:Hypothetical_protein n=1 Tax=Hexamita inflata TaxID=28002 RepID=A0AA86UWQ8_9EUKA|nr:Hypothetical protein HINF_LOCUS55276 [Hexamita inflata]